MRNISFGVRKDLMASARKKKKENHIENLFREKKNWNEPQGAGAKGVNKPKQKPSWYKMLAKNVIKTYDSWNEVDTFHFMEKSLN